MTRTRTQKPFTRGGPGQPKMVLPTSFAMTVENWMKKGGFLRRIPFTRLEVISRHTLTNDAMSARAMGSCGWGCDDEQDNAPVGSSTNTQKRLAFEMEICPFGGKR